MATHLHLPPTVPGRPVRILRLGERPGHSATTTHFQPVYPFLGEGTLGAPGIYIGRDAYGGAWLYDPWALYERSALAGPNMVVVGQIGFAKSSLIKTYVYRQRVLPFRMNEVFTFAINRMPMRDSADRFRSNHTLSGARPHRPALSADADPRRPTRRASSPRPARRPRARAPRARR
jgi:hypothetical protein